VPRPVRIFPTLDQGRRLRRRRELLDIAGSLRATQCGSLFAVGQTVGQPTRTVADISDPAHAPDTPLPRIPRQRFCPDTEEVTGSNPVSPTSITPGQSQIPGSQTVPGAGPETVAYLTAYLRTRADRPRTLRRRRGSASSVSSGLHAARRTLHKKRAQTPLRPAPKFQDASTPDPYCMFPLACSPWLRVAIAPDGSVTAVRCRVDPAHATALGRPRGRRSSDRSLAGVFRSLRNGLYGRGRCVRPPRSRWRAESESGTRRSRCDAGRRSCGPIVGRAPASRSDRNQVIRAVIGPSSR